MGRILCGVVWIIILFIETAVRCDVSELKWREDHLRKDLTFPDSVFTRYFSSAVICLAMCSQIDDCDGVSYDASTLTCRGYSLVDVTDIKKGISSPGTRFWINRNCQRNDYMYIRSLDWCIKLVWTIWPRTRNDVMADCKAENARLVNVDSREKHNVLVRKLGHILLLPLTTWWISGREDFGVWKWDDGTRISMDSDLWNTLPPVLFISDCLCYLEQLIPPGKRFWPCVCTGSNGFICEKFP